MLQPFVEVPVVGCALVGDVRLQLRAVSLISLMNSRTPLWFICRPSYRCW